MIAKARAVPHGNAYTTYSTLKKDAILIGVLNMDCDTALSMNPAEDAWEEFKNEVVKHHNRIWEEYERNPLFKIPKKEVTRTMIAMEVSPSMEESADWKIYETDADGRPVLDTDGNQKWHWDVDAWYAFGYDFLRHMDDIEFSNNDGKVSAKKTNLCNSKVLMMLHTDAKSGIPHLHFMVSRFDMDGFTNCSNLIGMKAVAAANQINEEQGWVQSKDISKEHTDKLKDVCYNVLRRMNTWDLNSYFEELAKDGYKTEKIPSNGDTIEAYRIYWGNSRYKASDIGSGLTVKKLPKEWQKVHDKMEADKKRELQLKQLIEQEKKKEIERLSARSKTGENRIHFSRGENDSLTRQTMSGSANHSNAVSSVPSYLGKVIKTTFKGDDGKTGRVNIPQFIYDTIKDNIDLPEEADYENEENGIPDIPDITEAMEIAVATLFEMAFPDVPPSSVGGGGGSSSGGWNDKDKDEWERLAKAAAGRASVKCTPAHSKPIRRGLHR